MGKRMRTVAGLTTAGLAAVIGLQAQPAQAAVEVPASGLTIFEGTFAAVLLHVAEPDGACLTMPPTAASLTGERIVAQVSVFTGPGCTGLQQNLGTFRTFTAGKYQSFRAYSF
ncbi:hypothetical protein [Paractinoplanes brasiliensis]|uniref:Beta/gamma crystallin n=1 Tax=Paractinoplanes brasiliensis TaxID=52695 RepID=A0A4R6JL54_9ACTN|nr:hypothetical protein [Actinoplanes brasiliensis]TDO37063.1 hypothetical protein C8E87_0658 [Actinoplanes brasiliensis]GID32243.1 hypothetical protein Abr02nite_72260 [Actinoplanes brasiliensis]